MRIAVELPFDTHGKRGWIFYVESLLREYARLARSDRFIVFNFFFRDHAGKRAMMTVPDAPNIEPAVKRWPESLVNSIEWNWKMPLIESYLACRGAEVFHAARVPCTGRVPVVYTSHDIMFVKHPDHMSESFRWGWEACGLPGMRLAARVIVSSDAHKRELVEYLGVDERRVRVIPMGANTGLFRPLDGEAAAGAAGPEGEAGRFVLIIGPVERWWCRYETVFEAFAPLSLSHPDLRLVVVGDDASEAAGRLRALAERLNISSRVLWLGRVPAARLNILLNRAACTVYPAWDTGCSLNVLDSMAAGCPVVTSPLSLLPELLGEAGVWADPFSPAGMEAALRRLVEDPEFRRACSEACLARAAERTWEKTARATLEVYREAAG